MTKSCPYCGNVVDDHIGKCPRCGLDFANRPAGPPPQTSSSPGSPGGFPAAPDPFSSPEIWNPSKGQPVLEPVRNRNTGKRIMAVLASLIVVGGLIGGFFWITREVTDRLDRPTVPVASITTDPDNGGGGGKGGKGGKNGNESDGPPEVAGARELFKLMKRNGAPCTGYNHVIDSTTVDAASCFAGTEAWTIQVFYDDLSYDAVVANYTASDDLDVAYGGNWTVLVQTEKSARRIARAMKGDWS